MALKVGGEGDVTKSNLLWRKKMATTDAAGMLGRGDLVYQVVDRGKNRGVVACIKVESGEVVWESKLPKSPSTYYASPILVGDTMCIPREDGVVFMAKSGEAGLGEIKENRLEEPVIASPIYVDGKLILRGAKHLWALK